MMFLLRLLLFVLPDYDIQHEHVASATYASDSSGIFASSFGISFSGHSMTRLSGSQLRLKTASQRISFSLPQHSWVFSVRTQLELVV